MGTLRRPSDGQLIEYLMRAAELPLNHCAPPPNSLVVRHEIALGRGAWCYDQAASLLLGWGMIPEDLVELYWAQRPLMRGTTAAIGIWVRGLFWLNPIRITERTVPPSSPTGNITARVVWRTVEGHPLVGHQAFSVQHCGQTDDVRYVIEGAAQPAPWLRMSSRTIQSTRRAFAERSCAAMQAGMTRPRREPLPGLTGSLAKRV